MSLTTAEISPFVIAVPDAVLVDLRSRLAATRWPDEPAQVGWEQGTNQDYLRALLDRWRDGYDWRAHERRLNELAHFTTDIDGLRVHFVHERGRGPAPMPLVLTHGWPSSFVEYLDLIPLLTDPASHGADPDDAFDVVVPSLPGYGFSGRPDAPGMVNSTVADMWSELMRRLGYDRFGAHGSDIGGGVTSRIGQQHPEAVVGLHLSAVGLPVPPQPWSDAETAYFDTAQAYSSEEGAYSALQSTKPQTLAYALNDSPAGLAAWIVEKFRAWSDCGGDVETRFSRDQLLTNLTVYWVTETIASSMRMYWDYRHRGTPLAVGKQIPVPCAFAIFGNEFRSPGRTPRDLAERYYTVTRWTEFTRGGHFPALEEPQLLAADIREFFRPLRRG